MGYVRHLTRRAWAHDGFQRYFKNTSWIFGTKILTMAISFLATLYIARNLGPTNYGQLSYATSFVALFGFVASLGIDTVLYRDLIRFPERRETLLGTAFFIKIIAGTFAAMLAIAFSFFLVADDVSSTLILILSGTFILNAFQIILFDFQARTDPRSPSIAAAAISLLLNILKVVVIAQHKGIIYLACILLLESVLYAIAYLYMYAKRGHGSIRSWKFDRTYAHSLLADSIPLIAFNAFAIIYARIDQVLIKHLIDARAVGIYDAAVRVAELWSFIPGMLTAALYPAIVNAKSVSDSLYTKRLGRLALLVSALALLVSISVSFLAPSIIHILYGDAFIGSVPILRVYIWAFIGTSLGIIATQYLTTENYRKILTAIAFFPMVLNVLLNLVWVPRYGIIGAAYATLLSYSLVPLMLLFFKPTRVRVLSIVAALFPRLSR